MIDTLLQFANQDKNRFEYEVAIDAAHPIQTAHDCQTPTFCWNAQNGSNKGGWIFHVNCKNVLANRVILGDATHTPNVRFLFQETEGRSGKIGFDRTIRIEIGQRR